MLIVDQSAKMKSTKAKKQITMNKATLSRVRRTLKFKQ